MGAIRGSRWRKRGVVDSGIATRCAAMRAELNLPPAFSVADLCRAVQDRTGRPIVLHPMPVGWAPAGLCGLLASTDSVDHVLFTSDSSLIGQATTIAHECGHILYALNDTAAVGDGDPRLDLAAALDLAPSEIRRVRGRSSFGADEEQTVELFASMVVREASAPPARWSDSSEAGRLTRIFG